MKSKRISTELTGDNAIRAEVLYLTTGLSEEIKKDADAIFFKIALLAVEKAADECRRITGNQFPTHANIIEYLERGE